MNSQPQVSLPSYALAIALALIVIGGLYVLLFAAHRTPPPPATPGVRYRQVADDAWIDKLEAMPAPSPLPPPAREPTAAATTSVNTAQTAAYTPYNSTAQNANTYQSQPRQAPVLAALSINQQSLEVPRAGNQAESDTIDVKLTPLPPHTIAAFTWIPGTLQTPIDSDHSGDVLGRVSVDVRDSLTGTEALIPAGSILHGWHGGRDTLDQNDESLQVIWRDIELPGRRPFHLPDMPGGNAEGQPGFADLINHHDLRTWIPAILTAGITAATNLATQPTYGSYQGCNPLQMAVGAGTQSLSTQAISQLASNLHTVKPTMRIEAGYKFVVLCTKNLVFDDSDGE